MSDEMARDLGSVPCVTWSLLSVSWLVGALAVLVGAEVAFAAFGFWLALVVEVAFLTCGDLDLVDGLGVCANGASTLADERVTRLLGVGSNGVSATLRFVDGMLATNCS